MKISFLNLDRSPDRLHTFLAANKHLNDLCRIVGIDGMTQSREELRKHDILAEDVPNYTPGAIGCALSHIEQWKRAVGGSDILTLAEDDAIFHHDYEELATGILATLPKGWDIIQWGWNFDSILVFDLLPGVSSCGAIFEQDRLRVSVETFQKLPIKSLPYRLHRSFGTVCQSVSPSGAAKLLAHCLPIRKMEVYYPLLNKILPNTGLDSMLNKAYPLLNAYVAVPPLVLTKNERQISTVQQIEA